MQAQLEYDMQGAGSAVVGEIPAEFLAAKNGGRGPVVAWSAEAEESAFEAGDDGCCDEGDACCDDADFEDDVQASEPVPATDSFEAEVAPVEVVAEEGGEGEEASGKAAGSAKRRKASSSRPSARLDALAKPRQLPDVPLEVPKPPPKPVKKPRDCRPSTLLRLRPTNLEEAREAFFASGFTEAPRFIYAYPDEVITQHFEENNNVCFELLGEAKRILQRVHDEYGGPEAFMQRLYGEERIQAEELREIVADYLREHNVEDKVEIRIVEGMLSAANVYKNGEGEYTVNLAAGPVARTQVQGICDHEVGTHLLRMMNDEHQAWHGQRERYKLANPWITEEGFATINTFISMPVKLLYPQALKYFFVCRGAQTGFVELFQELRAHVSDPKRCWQMCCRIKRGMVNTAMPGAFYMDQAYFKGAVEILRHLDEVDFGRLYGGQIALQDMDKVYFLLRKEVVRLPRFLNSAEKLKTYKSHCKRLIKENQIEAAGERLCKTTFVRTGREFFKQKQKAEMKATVAIGTDLGAAGGGPLAAAGSRTLDLGRLQDLAKPRQVVSESESSESAATRRRELDQARLAALSKPRSLVIAADEEAAPVASANRALDLAHLESLARPRPAPVPDARHGGAIAASSTSRRPPRPGRGASAPAGDRCGRATNNEAGEDAAEEEQRRARRSERQAAPQEPPPPPLPPDRFYDPARLAALAMPRKCAEDVGGGGGGGGGGGSAQCRCPAKRRKRRATRCRLLALARERRVSGDTSDPSVPQAEDEEVLEEDEEARLEPEEGEELEAPPVDTEPQGLTDAERFVALAQEEREEGPQPSPRRSGSRRRQRSAGVAAILGSSGAQAQPEASGRHPALSDEAPALATATLGGVALAPQPARRIVARARSLGATEGAKALAAGGGPGAVLEALGLGIDVGQRRPRLPVGLPRAALPAACADAAPAWKAVPIKQLELAL